MCNYKVFAWREGYKNGIDFFVWADDNWYWISSTRCEPTNPALFTEYLIPADERKFVHYYVGDEVES